MTPYRSNPDIDRPILDLIEVLELTARSEVEAARPDLNMDRDSEAIDLMHIRRQELLALILVEVAKENNLDLIISRS